MRKKCIHKFRYMSIYLFLIYFFLQELFDLGVIDFLRFNLVTQQYMSIVQRLVKT